jgi:hypothetical protein
MESLKHEFETLSRAPQLVVCLPQNHRAGQGDDRPSFHPADPVLQGLGYPAWPSLSSDPENLIHPAAQCSAVHITRIDVELT